MVYVEINKFLSILFGHINVSTIWFELFGYLVAKPNIVNRELSTNYIFQRCLLVIIQDVVK